MSEENNQKHPTTQRVKSKGRPKGSKDTVPRKPMMKFDIGRKKKFLNELKKCGSLVAAASFANVSRQTIYHAMRRDPVFERMVNDARDVAMGTIEQYAYKRVLEGEKTIKKDGEGNILEVIEKPASAALVARMLDATDTYKKESVTNHLHLHQKTDNTAIVKLAQALGVNLSDDDFSQSKDITNVDYEEKEDD